MLVKCSCLVRCDALAAPNVKTNNKNKEIKLAFQYIGNNNEKQWQRSPSAAQSQRSAVEITATAHRT